MFRLLSEGKLIPYLRRTLPPEAVLVFIHIPKTAGSSLTSELHRLLPPYMNLAPDYTEASRPFQERMDEMLERFVEKLRLGQLRSASGHYMLRRLRRALSTLPDSAAVKPAFVSMVREPVTRVVSDYAYMTSPAHPDHAAAKERFPTLEAYVDSPHTHDKMAKFLLANPQMPEDEIPAFLDRTYRFIGTVEEYAMSSHLLFALAGISHVSTARVRVAPSGPTRLDGLDPALVARIAALNRQDAAIHRHVSGVLARIRPAWEARMKRESRPG